MHNNTHTANITVQLKIVKMVSTMLHVFFTTSFLKIVFQTSRLDFQFGKYGHYAVNKSKSLTGGILGTITFEE